MVEQIFFRCRSEKKACRELRQFLPTVLDIWWILRSGLVEISMIERQEQCSFSVSEDLQENVHTSFRTSQSEKWILVMQDVLWVASIAFIVYMGDWNSNLIHVLWKDERIKRTELYLGLLCALLNVLVILFITTPFSRDFRRADEESEILTASSAPTIIILGLLSFFWLSVALWPIWSFFTLPLLALDPY